jgi:hypothetical protein
MRSQADYQASTELFITSFIIRFLDSNVPDNDGIRQQSLADEGIERYRKPTHRNQLLAEMEQIIPWRDLCRMIKPYYPKPKGAGRRPIGQERIIRKVSEHI